MKTVSELLSHLQNMDVNLWTDGDRLRYKAPSGVLTEALRNELQERKLEIIGFLHKKSSAGHLFSETVRPVPRDRNLPLSFAQQRIWFLSQLESDSAAYNELFAYRFAGPLNIEVLEQSLAQIIQRHEVLRTTFSVADGDPVQVIASSHDMHLPVSDIKKLPENEQAAEVQQLAAREVQQPFDMEKGPLLRFALLRLGTEDHILVLIIHHIIFDGWSLGIFNRELSLLYNAFLSGRPSPLPELPIQYADFAHWHRQRIQGDVLQTRLTFWKQQLAGAPPVLELPTDRPRPPVQTFQGRTERFHLNPDLTRNLKTLGKESGATLFMTLLAAFVTLLARYTGQEDIVVGSPIANRNRMETEPLIGFFVNTLVLRTDVSGNPCFSELLKRVRKTSLEAYAHQDIPFETLVEALQPERNLSHTPIFQVMFVLQNAPVALPDLTGLTVSQTEPEIGTAAFDLTLFITETGQGLSSALEYSTNLFDTATITRMAGHFQTLLEGIVSNPEQPISVLPLLTEPEQRQILVEWNNTKADCPSDVCVHELFEAQARQRPDAVAVVFEDQQLTYQELNRRANQMAHYLRSSGVGPDVPVGICMERSTDMLAGLIGILKAGGAYVPLDPDYPEDRLNFMLEDSKVPVLLTQEKFAGLLSGHRARVICPDADWDMISGESEKNPVKEITHKNLAYIIYTSGSTGKPKGVMNTHHGICNYMLWLQETYQLMPADRIVQKTPLSFDASAEEIFWPLVAGAGLVFAKPGAHRDSAYLVRLISEKKITILTFVPSMLQVFLEEQELEICSDLRHVICGGEALSFKLQERFFNRLNARLHNTYGPTEAAVCVSFWECRQDRHQGTVPIGRPVANTQLYILDKHLQPVPIGVPGELHIGGVNLARGYLNQPGLTKEKFIPDPFSDVPDSFLYKTGDLARYLSDGNIEYVGRIDNQVKIRGFRIEPGETEAVLSEHPGIQEAVVVARDDLHGHKRLAAYFVAAQEYCPGTSELRNFLKKKLPDYMIPSDFVSLARMPLLPNGKTDWRALPAPGTSRPALDKTYTGPRNSAEELMAGIWADILGLEQIGVRDNFFELGGHSLLAVTLINRINKEFGKKLPLAELFQEATIEHLSDVLTNPEYTFSQSSLVGMQVSGSKPPFFCVHPGGGTVLCYIELSRHLGADQPFYGIQARGLYEDQPPFRCIKDMASYYIKLLRGVQPEGPYLLGGFCTGGVVAFEMAHQLRQQGQQVALLALLNSFVPKLDNISKFAKNNEDTELLAEFFKQNLGGTFTRNLSVPYDDLRQMKLEKQLNYILEKVRKADVLPADLGVSEIGRLFKIFKAVVLADSDYKPQLYPEQITIFQATEKFDSDWTWPAPDWGELSTLPLEIFSVPGNHFTMLSMPGAEVLARQLNTCLDRVRVKG